MEEISKTEEVTCFVAIDEEGRFLYKTKTGLRYIDLYEATEGDTIVTLHTDSPSVLYSVLKYYTILEDAIDEALYKCSGFLEIIKVIGKNEFTIL